jgi:hypothetical protein
MQLCMPTPLCGQERRVCSELLHCTFSKKMSVSLEALGNRLTPGMRVEGWGRKGEGGSESELVYIVTIPLCSNSCPSCGIRKPQLATSNIS